jgi:hypothetical protein
MRWLAECLSEIERDPNHYARRAFGMSAKGIPPDDDLRMDYLLYVGLARRQDHTKDSAIAAAAKDFKKDITTIEKAVRGMRTHLDSFGMDNRQMADVLLQHGRKLPPQPPPKKRAGRPRNTPAKK